MKGKEKKRSRVKRKIFLFGFITAFIAVWINKMNDGLENAYDLSVRPKKNDDRKE